MTDLLTPIQAALDLPHTPLTLTEAGALPSTFAVTDLACASLGAAGQAVAQLIQQQTGRLPGVSVDRRLASFWFSSSIRPVGWETPPLWDPVAGDYAGADGWIRLHTNAPHHRAAAERVLGKAIDRSEMAAYVAKWKAAELEQAIVDEGGCAAQMRSWQAWQSHPQGLAVNAEALVQRQTYQTTPDKAWLGSVARPLAGLKVLDLTRVLAGPVASRFLAGLGADVLRIDSPSWNEPGVVPEMTLGKRCARLDLKSAEGRRIFDSLLQDTDILFHGYRADALEQLGYTASALQTLAPWPDRREPERLRLERPVAQSPRFRQPGADEQRDCRGGHGLETSGQTGAAAVAGAGSRHRVLDGGQCASSLERTLEIRAWRFGAVVVGAYGKIVGGGRAGAGAADVARRGSERSRAGG